MVTALTNDDTLISIADTARRRINDTLNATRESLGQFMTPGAVAEFMTGLPQVKRSRVRILDPGAGTGMLTASLVDRLLARKRQPLAIWATCYEIDSRLFAELENTLAACRLRCQQHAIQFGFDIRCEDYVSARATAARSLFSPDAEMFDCVVMNPPYRKISGDSDTRLQLRALGIETSNLYSAFMLLAARQLSPGGEYVSITPRSFCNGPYFRPFRRQFLQLMGVRRLHVFESRSDVFSDDGVLQENIVVYGTRRQPDQNDRVVISATDALGAVSTRTVSYDDIVRPNDPEAVIHIVTDDRGGDLAERMRRLPETLASLGLSVSTGRVVDFRAREHLRACPASGAVPLIYSTHLRGGMVKWPNDQTRKPSAIVANAETANLLVPAGFYVLTKRFSTKEERRRIVAAIYDPGHIAAERVGFDNKTNYFHLAGAGMDGELARGLTIFLNSTMVDEYFRLFSGHTQVNAADLRRLPYPSAAHLRKLAHTVKDLAGQAAVDTAIAQLF